MVDEFALMRNCRGITSSWLEVVLCYEIDAPLVGVVEEVLRAGMGFSPASMICGRCIDEERFDAARLQSEDRGDFEVYGSGGGDGPVFGCASIPAWRFKSLYWSGVDVADSLMDLLAEKPGFTLGYKDDLELTELHSLERAEDLRRRGIDLGPGMSEVDDDGQDRVSARFRPAMRALFPGMWLKAGWKMWLSPLVQELLFRGSSIEALDAYRSRPLSNGGVFLELHSAESGPEVAFFQRRKFRNFTNMDWLGVHSSQFLEGAPDPASEFSRKDGSATLTAYLDENMNPCRRSRAAFCRTVALDETGAVLRSEIQRIGGEA